MQRFVRPALVAAIISIVLGMALLGHAQTPINVAGFKPSAAAGSTLLSGLKAYYKLEDTSDSSGSGYTLTNNNTATFNTGKVSNAGYVVGASNQYFSRATNSDLEMGGDRSFAGWVYLASTTAEMNAIAKDSASGREYRLIYNAGSTSLKWNVFDSGGSESSVDSSFYPTTGTWYFVFVSYNTTSRVAGISVNDGTIQSSGALGSNPTVSSTEFDLGRRAYGGYEGYWDGRLDEWGVWNRILTSTEVTCLYQSGSGTTYPFTGICP